MTASNDEKEEAPLLPKKSMRKRQHKPGSTKPLVIVAEPSHLESPTQASVVPPVAAGEVSQVSTQAALQNRGGAQGNNAKKAKRKTKAPPPPIEPESSQSIFEPVSSVTIQPSASEQTTKSHGKDSLESLSIFGTLKDAKKEEEKSGEEPQECAREWIQSFTGLKILLIIFGQWIYSYKEDSSENKTRRYIFEFNWKSAGFFMFIWTFTFNFLGILLSGINVIDILMMDKMTDPMHRTKTQIIEQGLMERHTMILIIILGSYGLNLLNLVITISKRHVNASVFTKWTRFLSMSKLRTRSHGTYNYVIPVLVNFFVVLVTLVVLVEFRMSATFIGGPTVISILVTRPFLSSDYLEKKFRDSDLHVTLHYLGLFLYFYVTFTTNVSMYMFLWLLKSIRNAILSWNERLSETVEAIHQADDADEEVEFEAAERKDFTTLYNDHIGWVRMLRWFNDMYAGILEPWLLFFVVKIVYQIYLSALVLHGNGKRVNKANLGKYFMRKKDYIPGFIISYENIFTIITVLMASAWLEDTAYESYDELREVSLLKGPASDKESFFLLSMFHSYTSTTKSAVYAADYFTVCRYTVLHVISAIVSNFLVVYQFRPFFDTDTYEYPYLRTVIGNFLTSFEDLPKDHLIPVSDEVRFKDSP